MNPPATGPVRPTRGEGPRRPSITLFGAGIALAIAAASVFLALRSTSLFPLLSGSVLAFTLLLAIRGTNPSEKAAVEWLGRYIGVRGPGIFLIVPFMERVSHYIDQSVRMTSLRAEPALTRDKVPITVQATISWVVSDAEKAIHEVANIDEAVSGHAQTKIIAYTERWEMSQLIDQRTVHARELQSILNQTVNSWGVTVRFVEIEDIQIYRPSQRRVR